MSATTSSGTPPIPPSARHPGQTEPVTATAARAVFAAHARPCLPQRRRPVRRRRPKAAGMRRPRRPRPGRRRRPSRRRRHRPLRGQRYAPPTILFRNRGGLPVRGEGRPSRAWPPTPTGGYLAGMGVACGDLDGDGRLDLAVTNFFGELTTFYHNLGDGLFSDRYRGDRPGRADPLPARLRRRVRSTPTTTAGSTWPTANGHVNDLRPSLPFAMPAQLLLGGSAGRLVDVSDCVRPPWHGASAGPRPGRRRPGQ